MAEEMDIPEHLEHRWHDSGASCPLCAAFLVFQRVFHKLLNSDTKTIAHLVEMSKSTVNAYLFKLEKLLDGRGTIGVTAESF